MCTNIKSRLSRILAFTLIFVMCFGMIPNLGVTETADAATKYKFARDDFMRGGGDVSTRFTLYLGDRALTGLCRHGGPDSHASGYTTISRLDDDDNRLYLAYYYGYKKGWTSGANGCDLARAFHYATYKVAYHQTAERSKSMISTAKEYCKKYGVPSNFVAYNCNPTDGSQEFIAWGWWSSGKAKLVKKSSDTSISKAPGYTFKGIKYKVYEKQSTSSTCYGTFTVKADGTTDKMTLAPDGPNGKTYYVKESETNSYYEKDTSWHKITIYPGETSTLTVKDKPVSGTLTFNKTLTSNTIKGSTKKGFNFTLINNKNTKLTYNATSDANGKVTFTKIPIGTYTLKETLTKTQVARNWISITKKRTSVTIKGGSNTTSNWTNERDPFDPKLYVYKTTDDGGDVSGFSFTIKNTTTGKTYTKTTDEDGKIVLEDVPAGTYKVTENMTDAQKARYYQPASQTATLASDSEEHLVFYFENNSISHPVKLKKTATDGKISGIGFTLTGTIYPGTADEEEIIPISTTTDEDGMIDFGELLPGDYVIEETGWSDIYINKYPLAGYDNPAQEFSVTSDGVVINGKTSTTGIITFENIPYKIKLKKTEILIDGTPTTNPVANAEFSLYSVNDGIETFENTYMTNENGELEINEICKGDYVLKETSVPAGYEKNYDENGNFVPLEYEVTVDDDNDGVAEVEATNKQSSGSLLIVKNDDYDDPVESAQFTVYSDSACSTVAKDFSGNSLIGTTNKYGYLFFDQLPWGTYYIKETKAPRGYTLSTAVETVIIGKDSTTGLIAVDHEVHFTDSRKPGTVILTKTDTEKNVIEAPAVYSLFKEDGTLVKSGLTTGADNNGDGELDGTGNIRVDGLEWGSYYFLETQAPAGYALSDEKITVSVNAMSCSTVQYKKAVDSELKSQIIATKKILADDIWSAHGTPTFIFKLTGTTMSGEEKTYYRELTFSENYVKEHTDADGYVSMSTTFANIPVGDYVLSEEPVARYALDQIEKTSLINGTISGETVKFSLDEDHIYGAATFINKKYEWQDYSETKSLNNSIKKQRTYTGLYAGYNGEILDANMPVDNISDFLEVYAIYDDGTSKELMPSEYTVVDIDGNEFTRTPNVGGSYQLFITYEEQNISNTCTVQIQIATPVKYTVTFDTTGGDALDDMHVYKYNTLADTTNDKSCYTPTRDSYEFVGWYLDSNYTEKFDVNNTPITEDTTLYAKWEYVDTFAVYSSDDNSFRIYRSATVPTQGSTYNGLTVTGVYKGLANTSYTSHTQVPWYAYLNDIKTVSVENKIYPTSMAFWFAEMENATSANVRLVDTSNCTSLSHTFNWFGYLAEGKITVSGLAGWDVSNVTTMNCLFNSLGYTKATSFNIGDLSGWNTQNVTDMNYMFGAMAKNAETWSVGDLSNWKTGKVTGMRSMFYHAGYNAADWSIGDLSGWDVSNVTTMYGMFNGAGYSTEDWSVGDISNWKTGKVTTMSYMFYQAGANSESFAVDLSNWDVSKVTDLSFTFKQSGENAETWSVGDLSGWKTDSVTSLNQTFYWAARAADTFDIGDIGGWNVSNVSGQNDMHYMFAYAGETASTWNIGDLSEWETGKVTNMSHLFAYTGGNVTGKWTVGNLDNWDLSSCTITAAMFHHSGYNASTWTAGDLSDWNMSACTNTWRMFYESGSSAKKWNVGNLDNWDMSKVTNMSYMFDHAGYAATTWNAGDLSGWDTSSALSMQYMFGEAGYSAKSWSIGDLDNWNTSNVTIMQNMFYYSGYSSSTWSVGDLSTKTATDANGKKYTAWDVSNVTDMSYMFSRAGYSATGAWTVGSLKDWSTTNVTDMAGMFYEAGFSASTWSVGSLANWDVSNVTTFGSMFRRSGMSATSWKIGNVKNWVTSSATNMNYMFSNCGPDATWSTTSKMNLSGWDVSKVTTHTDFAYNNTDKITVPNWP